MLWRTHGHELVTALRGMLKYADADEIWQEQHWYILQDAEALLAKVKR